MFNLMTEHIAAVVTDPTKDGPIQSIAVDLVAINEAGPTRQELELMRWADDGGPSPLDDPQVTPKRQVRYVKQLRFQGNFGALSAESIRPVMRSAEMHVSPTQFPFVILDLTDVEMISAEFFNSLVRLRNCCHPTRTDLVVVAVDHVEHIFRLLRLGTLFRTFATITEAVRDCEMRLVER